MRKSADKEVNGGSLYHKVVEYYKNQIQEGNLNIGDQLPTESQIMQVHKVSRATVRQAMNILENENLIERIQGKGTFIRNSPQAANTPELAETDRRIGIVFGSGRDQHNMDLLLGVEKIAKVRGYYLSFAYAEENRELQARAIGRFKTEKVAGLIIVPIADVGNDPAILQLKEEGLPFVLIDTYMPEVDCDRVTVDHFNGGYRATEHLIILGYTRIGFAYASYGSLNTTSVRDRFEGYRKALQDYNIAFDENLIFPKAPLPIPEPPNLYDEYLLGPNRPEAIFAVNDGVALGFLQAAQRNNLKVPDELALVGFDNLSYAALLNPPLTTVAQPRVEVGLQGANLLINRIENQEVGPPQHLKLFINLIVRESCGARLRTFRKTG